MRLLILSAAAQATAASAPVAAAPPLLPPPPPHSKVDATTLQGKLMFGYQGWFDTPASGSPTGGGWVHWSPGVNPNATNSTFDLWPALDELPPTSCHPTPELTSRKTGEAMSLFSSFPNSTAHVHFRWMREYGLNGVFVQRFVNGVKSGSSQQAKKDAILTHALRAAEANGRVVSLMYDTSGAKESEWASLILADWHHLINDLRVLDSPAWLYHDSKAVLSIWGIGFTGHPGTPATSLQLLKDLRAISPITFVGGVPTHWREGKGDSKPGYAAVYADMDVLSPWLVGRYPNDIAFDSNYNNIFVQDLQRAKNLAVGWAPVVFPGFSWANLMRTTGAGASTFNQIPRRAGKFWEHQTEAFGSMSNGTGPHSKPLFIYAAMFDELDEGTAMLKVVSTVGETPAAPAQFLYYSADGTSVPSDFYLSLAGNFTARYHVTNSVCGVALGVVCEDGGNSPFNDSACDVCAGAHQAGVRAAGCDAEQVEAWCAAQQAHDLHHRVATARATAPLWREDERESAWSFARQLTEQKLAARLALTPRAGQQ